MPTPRHRLSLAGAQVYRRTILPLGILNVATALTRPADQVRPDTV